MPAAGRIYALKSRDTARSNPKLRTLCLRMRGAHQRPKKPHASWFRMKRDCSTIIVNRLCATVEEISMQDGLSILSYDHFRSFISVSLFNNVNVLYFLFTADTTRLRILDHNLVIIFCEYSLQFLRFMIFT